MALTLLAFDFDGVILESVDAKTQAFAQLAEPFGQEAADRLVLYHRMHGGVSRIEKIKWLYRECLGRECTPDELHTHAKRFVELALDNVLASPFVPGALEVLEHWYTRVPMCICSGTPSEELAYIVSQRGLTQYFRAGLYGTPPAKTSLLRQATIDAQIDPADAVMVGDASTDMQAAEAVGTRFYGRGREFAGGVHPWHDDLTKLNKWLEELACE